MSDAIISIKPRHVDNILSGAKTVELRTRSITLPAGSRLWVYVTLPVGKVRLSAEIMFTDSLPPEEVWVKYGKEICISKEEFDEYTKGRSVVSAIGLKNVRPLSKDISLNTMRDMKKISSRRSSFQNFVLEERCTRLFTLRLHVQ